MSSGKDPFGFERPKPGYSPRPITITVQPGQEIRIVVADASGTVPGSGARSDDSAVPSWRPDDSAVPSWRPDRR